MISRLFRTAFLAATGVAVFTAVRKLTKPGDPLPAPATPSGGPWPPLRPEPGADTAPTPSNGSTAPPATGRVTAPKPTPTAPTPPTPTEDVGAPVVVPEPDGTPVADAPTPGAAPSTTSPGNNPWAEADDDGNCPEGYPIKANLKSKIFHSPGQLNYDRTNPDRCYVDAASAEADGLRPAKR